MNTAEMRNQAKQYLDRLSPKSLELVADFLAYLVEKEVKDEREIDDNESNISALELAGDLVGCIDAETDLSTNKNYFKEFGES